MEKFSQIRRQLWQTFAELDDARGKHRRRCLRRARLLLLLVDDVLTASEQGDESLCSQPSALGTVAESPAAVLQVLAENAAGPAKPGSCQGLQSVLVLRFRHTQDA